jgi:hypothetical protein
VRRDDPQSGTDRLAPDREEHDVLTPPVEGRDAHRLGRFSPDRRLAGRRRCLQAEGRDGGPLAPARRRRRPALPLGHFRPRWARSPRA